MENYEWQLTKDKKNIQVYTREVSGSSLKAFKGTTVLEANNLSNYKELLIYVERYTDWMQTLKNAELKEKENENSRIVYVVFDSPWPLDNRDVYLRNKIVSDEDSVQMQIESIDGSPTTSRKLVRIPSLTSTMTFEQIDENKIRVTYEGHADPGGSVPSWAANAVVEDTPFKTLLNLHAMEF